MGNHQIVLGLKGRNKLLNTGEASLFGKEGSKGAGMMANVHANSVAGIANVLECHHQNCPKAVRL